MKFMAGADDEGEALDAAVDALRTAGHEVELLAAGPVARRRCPGRRRSRAARPTGATPLLDGHRYRDGGEQGAGRAGSASLGALDRRGRPSLERCERARDEPQATSPRRRARSSQAWLAVEAPDEDERENIAKLS